MATKERTGGRLLRFPRGDQVNVSRRAFLGLAEAGVGFLLGAVLAGAELFGLYAPFGVAAVAAAGSGLSGFCTLAGTCLGYLCLEGMTDGMRYAASAVLTYSVAFAFYDTKTYRRGWFMPAIAMLLCALTGIITRGGQGWHGEDLVYFLTEVLFTGAAAYGYRVVFKQWPETLDGLQALAPRQTVGLLLLGGTVLMSLARVEVLATFSLGRLAAAVGVMLVARRGVGGGALTGACAGVALDLASGEAPYYSLVLTLAGLLCGLCRDRRKGWAALVYALAVTVAVLWTWDGGRHMGLPLEAAVGAILFLVLPLRLPKGRPAPTPAQGADWEAGRQALSRKMGEMAGAFHTLCGSVKETLRPEEKHTENPAEIFTRAADQVCARCVLGDTCWQKDYQATRGACNDATGPMLARGRALATDFPGPFSARCVRFPEFLGEVNRQLTAFLRRRQALRRTYETRSALCSQYARLDHLLRTAAAEVAAGVTPDLPRQEKLAAFLRSHNLTGGVVYYDKAGRLRAEVPVTEELKTPAARRELSQVLGTRLREGEAVGDRLLFAQAEPYRATVSLAGAPRRGEKVSGDTGLWFRREDGQLFLLLCDGMGSGPAARQESAQAAKLLENFLRAGMGGQEGVETVSSALALRGEAGGSTTIDLLSLDLFTGKCTLCKQGAAPTYIRRGKGVRCAVGSSLPAGLVAAGEGAKPDVHRFRGTEGDWVVMVTDGVLCGRDDRWVRDLLAAYQGDSPSDLAQRILRQSQDLCQGEDDGTVLVARLEGREGG